MREFEFVDELPAEPPRRPGRGGVLDMFAEALREQPGRWAVWPLAISDATARQYMSTINGGKHSYRFSDDAFEAAYRDGVLYVRYGREEQASA